MIFIHCVGVYITIHFLCIHHTRLSLSLSLPSLSLSPLASFWTVEEVDLSKDLQDWEKLKVINYLLNY